MQSLNKIIFIINSYVPNSESPPNCRIPIEDMAEGQRSPPDGLESESSEIEISQIFRMFKKMFQIIQF